MILTNEEKIFLGCFTRHLELVTELRGRFSEKFTQLRKWQRNNLFFETRDSLVLIKKILNQEYCSEFIEYPDYGKKI